MHDPKIDGRQVAANKNKRKESLQERAQNGRSRRWLQANQLLDSMRAKQKTPPARDKAINDGDVGVREDR